MRALDFSRYSGPIDQAKIACWKEQGITRVIVQYNTTGDYVQALNELAGSGLEVHAYVGRLIYPPTGEEISGPGIPDRMWATQDAITRAQGSIFRLWQASEDGSFRGQAFNADHVRQCLNIQRQAGVSAGIYTARGYWLTAAGNTTEFSYLALFDARYLADGSPWPETSDGAGTSRPFLPYGGWDHCQQWQWHNTTTFCGHSVDLDLYVPNFWVREDDR